MTLWSVLVRTAVMASVLGGTAGCTGQDEPAPILISDTAETLNTGDRDDPMFASATPQTNVDDERPRIVAFGNSLTAGKGVAFQDSYPAQLQQRLDALGYHYQVINAGVSGETTAGGIRRVDWVLRLRPEIVILELGANDGLRGLPVKSITRNLEIIIQRLQAQHVQVILAGMKLPLNYGSEYSEAFAGLFHTLARRYGVPLIPFFLNGVAAQPDLNQVDGIHPTREGYRKIVEHNILPVLEPLLGKSL